VLRFLTSRSTRESSLWSRCLAIDWHPYGHPSTIILPFDSSACASGVQKWHSTERARATAVRLDSSVAFNGCRPLYTALRPLSKGDDFADVKVQSEVQHQESFCSIFPLFAGTCIQQHHSRHLFDLRVPKKQGHLQCLIRVSTRDLELRRQSHVPETDDGSPQVSLRSAFRSDNSTNASSLAISSSKSLSAELGQASFLKSFETGERFPDTDTPHGPRAFKSNRRAMALRQSRVDRMEGQWLKARSKSPIQRRKIRT